MKHHFLTITSYMTKNKAHAEMQAWAAQYDDCLMDDTKLYAFLDALAKKVREINEKYTRCQDITWRLSSYTLGSQRVEVEGNFYLNISEVKRFELSEPIQSHAS